MLSKCKQFCVCVRQADEASPVIAAEQYMKINKSSINNKASYWDGLNSVLSDSNSFLFLHAGEYF